MKKTVCVTLVLLFVFLFAGCAVKDRTENVKINLGESNIFSLEDRKNVADSIVSSFKHDKCVTELNNVYYAGDEKSVEEQQSRTDSENRNYNEIMVFMVSFHTSERASSEGFSPDEDYSGYMQIYGRTGGGDWEYIDGGY